MGRIALSKEVMEQHKREKLNKIKERILRYMQGQPQPCMFRYGCTNKNCSPEAKEESRKIIKELGINDPKIISTALRELVESGSVVKIKSTKNSRLYKTVPGFTTHIADLENACNRQTTANNAPQPRVKSNPKITTNQKIKTILFDSNDAVFEKLSKLIAVAIEEEKLNLQDNVNDLKGKLQAKTEENRQLREKLFKVETGQMAILAGKLNTALGDNKILEKSCRDLENTLYEKKRKLRNAYDMINSLKKQIKEAKILSKLEDSFNYEFVGVA